LPDALAEAACEPRTRVAVNGALLADKAALQAGAGDEIALLPPVSGG
jgi:molybdopterin synthase sulfur carrier subunit